MAASWSTPGWGSKAESIVPISTRWTPHPIRYIIVTQGHYDHVGGLDTMRDPGTQVVAQANWRQWRDDNERLMTYRARNSAFAFSDRLAHGIAAIQQRFGKRLPAQAAPTADIEVDDTLDADRRRTHHRTAGDARRRDHRLDGCLAT